jgi:ATP-dependent Clp protease adaptor protein ClpS
MAEDSSNSGPAVAEPKIATKPRTAPAPKKLPAWNVVLLNDDDHTYEYVIEMLGDLFNHSVETAYQMAKEVDTTDRVIVMTTHQELAELKRDQIIAYGADPRMQRSKAGMRAVIEQVDG